MRKYAAYLIIVVLSGILFLPFLGGVHLFDWDEINFAECAREMMVSGDYLRPQIDFMPFWEKPPLFIWMQVLSMKVFGVGAYAARFPNAIVGIVTLLSIFYVGKRLANDKVGQWWAVMFAASWLPHFYFKSGIIDPTFNLLIFLSFYQVHQMRTASRDWGHAIAAGLFLGMAALTKGPAAILIALLTLSAYIILNKGLNGYKLKQLIVIALCAAIPFSFWMVVTTVVYGTEYGAWFLNEFVSYQIRLFSTEDSDHGGPFIYHFIVLLLGCFPASAFLFQYSRKSNSNQKRTDFTLWMWLLFWVVLILFSIVKTKIVHYSSLCYFPLTYLAALKITALSNGTLVLKKRTVVALLVSGLLMALVVLLLPIVGVNKALIGPFIADPFAVANLRAYVDWSYTECLWGVVYIFGLVISVMLMRSNFRRGIIILSILQVILIQAVILHFTPKIEAYSQNAAIEYYKMFKGKDVYVQPLGYKSYANLFYTEKLPYTSPEYKGIRTDKEGRATPEANQDWLIRGNTDKPTFFICKITDSIKYSNVPELQLTGSKNGFVFYKRIR